MDGTTSSGCVILFLEIAVTFNFYLIGSPSSGKFGKLAVNEFTISSSVVTNLGNDGISTTILSESLFFNVFFLFLETVPSFLARESTALGLVVEILIIFAFELTLFFTHLSKVLFLSSFLAIWLIFRWFKFTLKPPYRITYDKLRLAIWDTSFWTFWVKFGHKGSWDIS